MTITEYKSLPKPRHKPVQRESMLQQACVHWFRFVYPQYRDLLYSIPNAGKRTRNNANRMKCEGVVSGFPDLGLAVPIDGYHGMFIEMKVKGNKPTPEQTKVMNQLAQNKYWITICKSLEQFQKAIQIYLS